MRNDEVGLVIQDDDIIGGKNRQDHVPDATLAVIDDRDPHLLIAEAEVSEREEFGDNIVLAVTRVIHEFAWGRPILPSPICLAVLSEGPTVEKSIDDLKAFLSIETGGCRYNPTPRTVNRGDAVRLVGQTTGKCLALFEHLLEHACPLWERC